MGDPIYFSLQPLRELLLELSSLTILSIGAGKLSPEMWSLAVGQTAGEQQSRDSEAQALNPSRASCQGIQQDVLGGMPRASEGRVIN